MGCGEYEGLVGDFGVPIVVGGFEPVDLLQAILMLVQQLEAGQAKMENQYVRSVSYAGNLFAQRAIREVFEVADQKWRGIGMIPQSGLRLRNEYAAYDANKVFDLHLITADEPAEAYRLSGVCDPVHTSKSTGGAHGLVGRGVRGLLPLPAPRASSLRRESGRRGKDDR
jgi:hydrogenase expression/formation protein HypD